MIKKEHIEYINNFFPMIKLFFIGENIYLYDAKANLLTQIEDNDIYQIYTFYNKGNLDIKDQLFKLLEKGVFNIGKLDKVVPDEKELLNIIDFQLASYIPRKFVLEITEECTLRCKYCFFTKENNDGRKHSSRKMSEDTAFTAIQYYFEVYTKAIEKASPQELEKILEISPPGLSWWGGEPFTNFDLMVKTKDYFHNLPWDKYYIPLDKLTYSAVSNFTILNEKIVNFIVNNNFYLFISLDGSKKEHDKNRVFKDGGGSFDKVIGNIDYLITHYPEFSKKRIIIQAVLADNIDINTSQIFFNDYFDADTSSKKVLKCLAFPQKNEKEYLPKMKNTIEEEYIHLFSLKLKELSLLEKNTLYDALSENDLLLKEFENLFSLENSLIFDNPSGTNHYTRHFSCPIGVDIIFVAYDGNIHMCNKSDYSFPIGNVKKGIDINLLYELYNEYYEGFRKKCIDCWAFHFCKVCPANILYKKKFYHPKKDLECIQIQKNAFINISKYIHFVQYEKLYEDIKSFCLDYDKINFLEYEKPLIVKYNSYEKD